MKKCITFILLGILFLMGCAHQVEFRAPDIYSYSKKVPMNAIFFMDQNIRSKVWSGRAFGSGIANRWDVPIGRVVEQYAESYLKDGFLSFVRLDDLEKRPSYDILIKITELNYFMAFQAAHGELCFVIEDQIGNQLWSKRYKEDGPSEMGKVALGGVFAQKSAIRQSTHVVLENIFKRFLNDIQIQYKEWKIEKGPN